MRIGIIGGGNISETHARAAASIPDVEVVAFHGGNRERTARLAAQFNGVVYEDLDRFLDHDPAIDIVAIGSPSGRHAEQGIAAARRGIHVLVEKPLDITTERADELIAAAEEAGVKLGVFFQDRLHPAVVEIRSMIDSGRLGSPVMISGRVKWHRPPEYYAQSRWRGTWALDGGGALINQAIHTVDLVQWLFGAIARVYGTTATRVHDIEVEDTAAAVVEFTSGALGTIEAATSVFPGYDRRLEVTGSEGTVVLEHDRLERVNLRSGGSSALVSGADANASSSSPVVSDVSGHRRILEDFIRAIETNGRPACDGAEGRKSVALVQAIYKSARDRSPVSLS
jgi:UDP-N-acetyl-2-amino-2-deoxyglucuronate dehydrogenase